MGSIYRIFERSVSGAVPSTVMQVDAEGAGMCTMSFTGINDARVAHIKVQADVLAICRFEVVEIPRHNNRPSWRLDWVASQMEALWPLRLQQMQIIEDSGEL